MAEADQAQLGDGGLGFDDVAAERSHDPAEGFRSRSEEGGKGLGAALGSAVHAVLESIDFDQPGLLGPVVAAAAEEFGVVTLVEEVERRVRIALSAPSIELARRHRHWRELYVAIPAGEGSVEGFIDLCIETENGLIVVDYKTDALSGTHGETAGIGGTEADPAAAKAERYRRQGATYAVALEHVTGQPVIDCRFVFIGPEDVIEVSLPDLAASCEEIRSELAVPTLLP